MLSKVSKRISPDVELKLPILSSKNRLDKDMVWIIYTEGAEVIRRHGLLDGKWQLSSKTSSGVNIGKKNEQSPEQHAEFDALSLWKKQIDKGYKPFSDDKDGLEYYNQIMVDKAQQGGKNHGVGTNSSVDRRKNETPMSLDAYTKPMLAETYTKRWEEEKKSVNKALEAGRTSRIQRFIRWGENGFFMLIQSKLDGERCVAKWVDGKIHLATRNSKVLPHLNHIKVDLEKNMPKDMELDGEIYCEDMEGFENETDRFASIQGACSVDSDKPAANEKRFSFYVFDIIDTQTSQLERFSQIDDFFKSNKMDHVKMVPWEAVHSHEEVDKALSERLAQNYEGIMLRDPDAMYYKNRRVNYLLKYKKFDDAEFEITDVVEANRGFAVYECWNKDKNKKFRAKPEGTVHVAKTLLANRDSLIGQEVTVKYQGMSANGIPRFPVAKALRKKI
jgi:hypothetical protein